MTASRRDTDVPTTSCAVLGMLGLRPWSAYELNKQLRRSLACCGPKTQSVLYDEPKRLAANLRETLIARSDQVCRDIEDWTGTKDIGMTSTARKQIEEVRDIAVRNLDR